MSASAASTMATIVTTANATQANAAATAAVASATTEYNKEALIGALMKMTYEVDAIQVDDADMTKTMITNRYIRNVELLGQEDWQAIDFSDCRLTDAHLIIIFEIIMHSPDRFGTLNFHGQQKFDNKTLLEFIVKMLQQKPEVSHCLCLPDAVASNETVKQLWFAATNGNAARILSAETPAVGTKIFEDIFGSTINDTFVPSTKYAKMANNNSGTAIDSKSFADVSIINAQSTAAQNHTVSSQAALNGANDSKNSKDQLESESIINIPINRLSLGQQSDETIVRIAEARGLGTLVAAIQSIAPTHTSFSKTDQRRLLVSAILRDDPIHEAYLNKNGWGIDVVAKTNELNKQKANGNANNAASAAVPVHKSASAADNGKGQVIWSDSASSYFTTNANTATGTHTNLPATSQAADTDYVAMGTNAPNKGLVVMTTQPKDIYNMINAINNTLEKAERIFEAKELSELKMGIEAGTVAADATLSQDHLIPLSMYKIADNFKVLEGAFQHLLGILKIKNSNGSIPAPNTVARPAVPVPIIKKPKELTGAAATDQKQIDEYNRKLKAFNEYDEKVKAAQKEQKRHVKNHSPEYAKAYNIYQKYIAAPDKNSVLMWFKDNDARLQKEYETKACRAQQTLVKQPNVAAAATASNATASQASASICIMDCDVPKHSTHITAQKTSANGRPTNEYVLVRIRAQAYADSQRAAGFVNEADKLLQDACTLAETAKLENEAIEQLGVEKAGTSNITAASNANHAASSALPLLQKSYSLLREQVLVARLAFEAAEKQGLEQALLNAQHAGSAAHQAETLLSDIRIHRASVEAGRIRVSVAHAKATTHAAQSAAASTSASAANTSNPANTTAKLFKSHK